MEEIYISEVLLALVRIGICIFIFFGLFDSLMNPEVKEEPFENRLIFKWTCFSGFLILAVLVLSLSDLYDLFGMLILMAAVILVRSAMSNTKNAEQLYGKSVEMHGDPSSSKRFLIWQLKMIEKVKLLFSNADRSDNPIQLPRLMSISNTDNRWKYAVICVAVLGGGLRLYPALQSPVPSNSNWFFVVQKVKDIRLQRLFGDIPEPPGFYAFVSFFNSISQVKPEMIVHFAEALLTIPVCLIIYWIIHRVIATDSSSIFTRFSAMFSMAVYAIAPVLILQDSLVHEIHQSKINAAFCLAVPAVYGFWHFSRGGVYKKLFFWGLLATALIDIFVFLNVLLPPLLMIALYSIYAEKGKRKMMKIGVLFASVATVVALYTGIIIYFGLDYKEFILWQLFNPQVYDTFSDFILTHPRLMQGYLIAGIACTFIYMINIFRGVSNRWAEALLTAGFTILLLLYSPSFNVNPEWIDTRQFFYVFTIISAIFWGIILLNILRFMQWLFTLKEQAQYRLALSLLVITILGFAFTQYEIGDYSRGEQTIPKGFFDSYYRIAENRVPYSYTVVAPTVMQIMSQNRNYFLEYNFFLDNFATYDSLYYQKIVESDKPIREIQFDYRPSPSVFLFLAKSPFNFQTNNINNVQTVMQRLEEWVQEYKTRENRELSKFYESKDAVVYELVYETGTSQIDETLYEVYTEEPWPMFEE
ncbi:hypothetical protein NC796_01420 [Aliifodinibius sp. S!AR15-10]|uniref:hypothetical protein n=1 Tax=Aliifodinibius sp. S!AR15-10 TaxID=2950437 RepID=UPI00286087B6|nr:hypothetical protein [Aliifodinibius sp. S!AR15-10]MDR8389776.1 hypothetical protein [Aliifodinibius sp. S!AR15-10]